MELHTETCSGTPALQGVAYLRWRVTGTAMEPVERMAPLDEGAAGVPPVPPGPDRVVEVRGYTALPGLGGQVVSRGRSHPFTVGGSGAPAVAIALRRVGEFTRPGTAEGCVGLTQSRAGHTATLLEDGRVLVAGGVQLAATPDSPSDSSSEPSSEPSPKPSTVSATEVFDPVAGTVERVPALDSARAFHTATRLPGGAVLLVGGEEETVDGPRPLQSARVLEVAAGAATEVEGQVARSHHAAVLDSRGRVIIVGGVGEGGEVVPEVEGYDPVAGRSFSVDARVKRVGMGLGVVGDRLAVVGGSDGDALPPEVLYLTARGEGYAVEDVGERLNEPRRDAALVPWRPGRLLSVGGHASPGSVTADTLLASSQIVSPDAAARESAHPQIYARSEPCAVSLPDGRVMTLGGWSFGLNGLTSDAHGELLVPGPDGSAPGLMGLPALEHGLLEHTCTLLEDGAVLIAGGLEDDGTQRLTRDDLLLYMPVPLD